VELYNPSAAPLAVGGYVFRDDDDTRGYTIPAGTTIPAAATWCWTRRSSASASARRTRRGCTGRAV
jgi:hypothetical protein